MSDWFLYINDKQEGPYTSSQIEEFINSGSINSNTYIFDNESQNWVLLGQKEEFKNKFQPTYFFYINEAQTEPYTIEIIKQKFAGSEIKPEDYIFDVETNQWMAFSTHPVFAEIQKQSEIVQKPDNENIVLDETKTELQTVLAEEKAVNNKPSGTEPAQEPKKTEVKINFPCKNHPSKESFLMCPECGYDYCDECLVKIGDKHYCKECYASKKEKIDVSLCVRFILWQTYLKNFDY
ncbi:MAG TPA: GYF domain-containing protein [bacterium]|nr:GYF domain-containing protein [bacterium]